MKDAYVNALNIQNATRNWMDVSGENMVNMYTPGYREKQVTFKTFLDHAVLDGHLTNTSQGKAVPGTSNENVFLEGQGFFVVRNDEGNLAYTRLGEFKFDSTGVYRAPDGSKVQGYVLNDKGEVVSGVKTLDDNAFNETLANGGTRAIPTTEIKMWIDPDNGKYLGKYEEYEIKGDGILYGKSNNGKDSTPLFKLAVMNFHNPQGLFEYKSGQFVETEESGKPVIGRGEVRSGLLELSNIDFKANLTYYQQAKMQMELSNQIITSYKDLLKNAIALMQ
ncbi:MAG: flagellar hook basal-body protein [Cyanobacteria bacterium SIG30]|nr:flagellar hook basal-body protein [Cyanobacteria bacterium SIG30]